MNEFKSQICTSIEQSKRLLELGLKPETAGCIITYFLHGDRVVLTESTIATMEAFKNQKNSLLSSLESAQVA